MRFYLGTHRPSWLGVAEVPLFVSRRTLAPRRALPRAIAPWALDSGGFSELSMHGEWQTTPETYAAEIRRFESEIGMLDWAAPQDWMCEPGMLAKTGLSVAEHQKRTVKSYLTLKTMGLPVIPVLQGWELDDYLRHVENYERAGVDLMSASVVGLGSVCRRQATRDISLLVSTLSLTGLRLHGFGVKAGGLRNVAHLLASADSMAWSYRARKNAPLDGCSHRNCANCLQYALHWREQVLRAIDSPKQGILL